MINIQTTATVTDEGKLLVEVSPHIHPGKYKEGIAARALPSAIASPPHIS